MGVEVLWGNPQDLGAPNTLFLAASVADALFAGEQDPLGETVHLPWGEFVVKGIYKDLPDNTTLRPDWILSFPTSTFYNWYYT